MNLFVSSNCPVKSAQHLDDKRVVKMCTETAQLLSFAVRHYGVDAGYKYAKAHAKHPCSVWVMKTKANFDWAVKHGKALCVEYSNRYNKRHGSLDVIELVAQHRDAIPDGELTPFPNCTFNKPNNIDFRKVACVTAAYNMYLDARWQTDKNKPKWGGKERD